MYVADLKGVHMEEGRGAWKRGDGCAVLKLADSPKRGARASVLSMVGGNLVIKFIEPKHDRWWPTLTLKFWVLTIDHRGNVLFPTKWDSDSQKLLCELARRKVEFFLQHQQEYPIRADFHRQPGTSTSLLSKENTPEIPRPIFQH